MSQVPESLLPSILFFSACFYFLGLYAIYSITMIKDHNDIEEHELCPICKNGMSCDSLVSHARLWQTEKRGVK
jgi:hypothetical protein